MTTIEKLAEKIYKECLKEGEPVTMEEALEMAEMEVKTKENRRYEGGERKNEEKKSRTVKVSDEKKELFSTILQNLTRVEGVEPENITVLTENKLIQVKIGDKTFKIDVIESRNKKNKA